MVIYVSRLTKKLCYFRKVKLTVSSYDLVNRRELSKFKKLV